VTQFPSSATTDPGGRAHNEDAFLNRPDLGLWAVADGAGGHVNGAAASGAVVAALAAIPPGLNAAEILAQVRLRLGAVHLALLAAAAEQGDGCVMATTVVVLIARGAHFACLWAGDSRAYRSHVGMLNQITSDHSLVQQLLEAGSLTEAEADAHPERNVITRAVGGGPDELQLDKVSGRLTAGDRFLLCSDGLCKGLAPAELAGLFLSGLPAESMVAAALERAPSDNVTAVIVEAVRDQDARATFGTP
jgi:serine/threonine-protein phosphatase Stp1